LDSEWKFHLSSNDQIDFWPIGSSDDIINYSENEGKLKLSSDASYMGAFTYLVDEIIKLEEAIYSSLVGKISPAFNEQSIYWINSLSFTNPKL